MTTILLGGILTPRKLLTFWKKFTYAKSFFLRVSDWKVVDTWARSDHSEVQDIFLITGIKSKVKENVKVQVDWTNIGENVETNYLFNPNMFKLLPK